MKKYTIKLTEEEVELVVHGIGIGCNEGLIAEEDNPILDSLWNKLYEVQKVIKEKKK